MPSLGGDWLIMLGWGIFYLHGLWPDATRELIQNIADKKAGFEKSCYPWRSEDPLLKSRWYPARFEERRYHVVVLNQLYDYFFASCFQNDNIRIIKTDEKGLQVMCNVNFGVTLNYVFGTKNPGILIPLRKSFRNELVEMGFDSIYEVSKDTNATVKDELFALVGVQSLLNHDDDTCGRLMHIEDSGRSLLLEWQSEHFRHFENNDNINPAMTIWTPIKVTQQTLPDGRMTPEELEDHGDPLSRYFSCLYDYNDEPGVVRYWIRNVTRGTFIKDLSKKVFKLNDEFVIKYADNWNGVMGRNPNKRVRIL